MSNGSICNSLAIDNEMNTRQNNELAQDILFRRYFRYFKKGQMSLELFLTGACKANCEYCYLKKHQSDLYPPHLHDNDTIIKNLQLILNWYIENEFTCNLDIFSAEWLTTPLADRVFDTIYNTFKDVSPEKRPKAIYAADNMLFLNDDKLTEKVCYHIDRLDTLGIKMPLSASVDGKYCDFGRTPLSDEYYTKLRDFLVKYNLRIHPMISASNVKYWKENFEWWVQNFPPNISHDIMTLEVRNNDWNEESINQLLQYCDYLADWQFNVRFKQNKKEFLEYILYVDPDSQSQIQREHISYNVLGLNHVEIFENRDGLSCSFGHSLPIRVGDLSVGMCHRLWYPELTIGHFPIVDGKLGKFQADNVSLLILKVHIKKSCMPKCENCKFQGVCIGHCCGASYEEYGNFLVPQMEVCSMYKSKISFLIYKYYTMGLFDNDIWESVMSRFHHERRRYLEELITDTLGGFGIEKRFC